VNLKFNEFKRNKVSKWSRNVSKGNKSYLAFLVQLLPVPGPFLPIRYHLDSRSSVPLILGKEFSGNRAQRTPKTQKDQE
jgi:hypothetical protein